MDYFDEFLQTSKLRFQTILDQLQWTEESVLRDFNMNSIASGKKIETENIKDTMPNCDTMLPSSCADSNSVILADRDLQQLLQEPTAKAPQNFSELQANFSREQKLILYEYTVKHKEEAQPLTSAENELVSLADIVAMKKREKTKRRKYRISKPTQTEEVRSLVELQMQALQQYLENKHKIERKKQDFKRETKPKDYQHKSRNKEQVADHKNCRHYENQKEKSSSHEKYPKKSLDRKKVDAQERKISESSKSRHNEFNETKSHCDAYRKNSYSRSRCRHIKRKSVSRSPSRQKRHHKQKHKKSRHDSR